MCCRQITKQDLSSDRIARLILHILFLENLGVGGGVGDCTVQNFGPICIVKPEMNQISDKVRK